MIKLCECGCGQPTPLAKTTKNRQGQVKGMPLRFINGHNNFVKRQTLPEPQDPNTRYIALTKGKFAIVDAADYEWLSQRKWSASPGGKTWYARCSGHKPDGKWTTVAMHRLILGVESGVRVYHKNGNGLDNRRDNLRIATQQQNQFNRGLQITNTSGYKGVSWDKARGKWRVSFVVDKRLQFGGYFDNPEEAARAYDEAARKHYGEFARLNFPGASGLTDAERDVLRPHLASMGIKVGF